MGIKVENARKCFGDFVALDDVSIEVRDGSLTALLGPSGSGKSTLLRVIAGLEEPDSGQILISGEDMTRVPVQDRNVGFCFQHYAAFKHMTVRRQRRLRALDPQALEEGDRRAGRTSCSTWCSSNGIRRTATRTSSPAVSASGWRWRGRSRWSRRCCCSTSRSAPSTRACAPSCASGCAACTTRST